MARNGINSIQNGALVPQVAHEGDNLMLFHLRAIYP